MEEVSKQRSNQVFLIIVGAILALAVGIIYMTPKIDLSGTWLDHLPAVNATINGTVSVLLMLGFYFIRNGKRKQHEWCMTASIALSALFLLSYVAYHVTHESTVFGGEGLIRGVYLFILLTHILLAIVIVPLVLISYARALSMQFEKHKKIARITFPLWLYVSVTGVVVYLMISPYY